MAAASLEVTQWYDRHGEYLVFAMATPWTVRHNKLPWLLRRLAAEGLKVVAFAYKTLSAGELEQLADPRWNVIPSPNWTLLNAAYRAGPSCGLLVWVPRCWVPAAQSMRRLKGNCNPALAQPGELRYDLRAPNRLLGLIHSADDWQGTLREATMFFAERLDQVLKNTGDEPPAIPERDILDGVGLAAATEQSAAALLLDLRVRAAARVQRLCPDSDLQTLLELWRSASEQDFLDRPVSQEIQAYLAVVQAEKPHLQMLQRRIESSGNSPDLLTVLLQFLMQLNAVEGYGQLATEAVVAGVPVFRDSWEKLLFRTTLFCFPELHQPPGSRAQRPPASWPR
jgi:nucleoside diphosphate kinase